MSTPVSLQQQYINALKRQLSILHWIILGIGILLIITLFLNEHLFENIIFLSLLGLVGYLFTRRIFLVPSITTLFLIVANLLKDLISPQTDTFSNYLFYIVIFFAMTLLGCLCGYFLKRSITCFKKTHGLKRLGIYCFWLALTAFVLAPIINFNHANGNPLSAYYVQCRMQNYLKTTYPECHVTLSHIQYHSKKHTYSAKASLYTDTDVLQSFNIYYTKGKVKDDYFTTYLEDEPNEQRINQQIISELTSLLTAHQVPFSTISCNLQLEKGIYNHVDFDKSSFSLALPLSFTILTQEKQSYDDFSKWCENIRTLLLVNGYQLSSLSFHSSPHWEENSLSLVLNKDELTFPIAQVNNYPGFNDLGIENHITKQETNPTPYNNFYLDEALSQKLCSQLKMRTGLSPLYVTASTTSLNDLILECYWTGDRISIDSFAHTTMALFNCLKKDDLLKPYSFQAISFKYCWGTSSESYEYSIYPENADEQSIKTIIDTLLTPSSEQNK